MTFKSTEEQEEIFRSILYDDYNLLIRAYAGCGKSTTMLLAIKKLIEFYGDVMKTISIIAFNKHIRDEMKSKLPEGVNCSTLHGIGYGGITRKYKDIKMDNFKVDNHIKKKLTHWQLDSEFKKEGEKERYIKAIKEMVDLCRSTLTTDRSFVLKLADKYDIKPIKTLGDAKRVLQVLESMTNDIKTFDYVDMIYMPAVDNKIFLFPSDYLLIEECLPFNTYISTISGKKRIGVLYNMFENGKQLPELTTYNENTKLFENKKINNIWCSGVKDIHCVELGTKRKLYSTTNHRFLTNYGWKRLDELKIGDAIITNYNRQPYHGFLDDSQKNIFVGSILGDGHFDILSNNICRVRVIHGEKQHEYIKWKASFFNANLKRIENNGYASTIAYTFGTLGYYYDLNIEETINSLTPQSLAIAWMDDGHLGPNRSYSSLYSLATNKKHVELISKNLHEKWNIQSKINTRTYPDGSHNDNHYLTFSAENTRKISKLISPYIHKSMEYKIIECDRVNIDENNWTKTIDKNIGCIVVTKEHYYHKTDRVFDMSVEDNHNFIITSCGNINYGVAGNFGIIAHNCQDICKAQQKMIEKMCKRDKVTKKITTKLIFVGDKKQAIYAFTGISEKSFDWFKEFPNTKELPLSYSFRCAKNIILEANKIVPEIKALSNAASGIVRSGDVLKEAQSGDFVLCRTTAPLIKLFFYYISQSRTATIVGSDIGTNLIDMVGGFINVNDLLIYWMNRLEILRDSLKSMGVLDVYEDNAYQSLDDKVTTLAFIAKYCKSTVDLKEKILKIFTDDKDNRGIILSTIHKSKGLEADRVFIVRTDLLPLKAAMSRPWLLEQEYNLKYVAITRARNELIYDYEWNDDIKEKNN